MKKLLSFALALILLFTMLPVSVFAAEDTTSEYEELVALACEVFPEYEDIICGSIDPIANLPRSISPVDTVFSETRKISDNNYMTYSQLSDGSSFVYTATYTKSVITNSTNVSGDVTHYNITIKGFCSKSDEIFILSGVEYSIIQLYNDWITNPGSTSSSTTYLVERRTYVQEETSTSKAELSYRVTYQWRSGGHLTQALLKVTVGSNSMNVTFEPSG